jgi:hypothetical protein
MKRFSTDGTMKTPIPNQSMNSSKTSHRFQAALRIGRTSCVSRRVRDTAKSDKGNTLQFEIAPGSRGVTIKEFTFTPAK